MQQVFHTTQGDRETIARQLTENGTPVDLGGRNVQFVARHESGDKVVDAPADVVSASAGYVSYTLTTLETGRAGDYSLEWIVTGGGDDPTTFPAATPDKLVVREDVEQTDAVADPLPQDRTVDALIANELNGNLTGNVPVTTLAGTNLSVTNGSLDAAQRTEEEIQDFVNALLVAGANVTLAYDDVANTLTVATPTEGIQDAAGGMATSGLAYDDAANTLGMNVVASGQVALSGGVATVDTGISAVDATFMLSLGVDDPNADTELAGRLFWDDTAGTYKVRIVEQVTSVGNPTSNYGIVRVR